MKSHCKHSLLLVLTVLLAACGDSDPVAPASGGEQAYLRHCASCHGSAGEGRAPNFPPLAGSEWMDMPPPALAAIVVLGLRGEIEVAGRRYSGFMPTLAHIGDEPLADIVNYARSRWSPGAGEISAEEVAALRVAVAGRGMLEGREDLEALLETLE